MDIACTVRLYLSWKNPIDAHIIGFAPLGKEYEQFDEHKQATGTNKTNLGAIVVLDTFSKGSIYHLPLNLIRIT